jgi:hypothetical protein
MSALESEADLVEGLANIRFRRFNSTMRRWKSCRVAAVIDSVTRKPALVNDLPQIDLDLDDADDLTDLLNKFDREVSASAKP